jgi:23S rRNA pseudouridine1911/1915/1917 synthase
MAEGLTVPPAAAGQRLDVFLAAHAGSRAAAQRLVDAGRVTVDGVPRPKRHVLAGGEAVEIAPPEDPPERPVAEPDYSVAWEDEHLIVVDKPPGVVVHRAPGHRRGTLAQALARRGAGGGDPERPGIVHRLDRDTSGLLVVARSEPVHAALKAQLARRQLVREYLALVDGRPAARRGTIDAPLGRDRRVRTRVSTDTDEPRGAITHFAVERALPHETLLRVRLETGRTHQIRAHLKAIGHPVVGDPEYGTGPRHGLERQFLHAARLAFRHPVSGDAIDVSSPLPPDLAAALALAERVHAGRTTGGRGREGRPAE